METELLRSWLELLRAPGMGPATLNPLLAEHGDPRLACQRSEALRRYSPDPARIEADLAWCALPGNHLIPLTDPRYPALLKRLDDAPTALFVHGDPDCLALPQLAMVGSRNPSDGGRTNARQFSRYLAAAGLTITSGLALGIDAAAHEGALDADGITIAVTGTGLDRVYPASHRELAHRIAEQGALISEFPPGTPPRPGNFPRRNRLISGLALGTLVVEATLKSGSLITAQRALEQNREVFAIPGSIHNPLAKGCHALIRQGAKLVEKADDILEELGTQLGGATPVPLSSHPEPGRQAEPLDAQYQSLLAAMGHDPVSADQLIARTGFAPAEVASMILLLEMAGHVSSVPGGLYARAQTPADG